MEGTLLRPICLLDIGDLQFRGLFVKQVEDRQGSFNRLNNRHNATAHAGEGENVPFYAEKNQTAGVEKGEQYHLGSRFPGRRVNSLPGYVPALVSSPVSVAPAGGYGTALVSNSGKRRASGRFPRRLTPLPGYGAGQ